MSELQTNIGLSLLLVAFLAYCALIAFITTHDFGKNAQKAK